MPGRVHRFMHDAASRFGVWLFPRFEPELGTVGHVHAPPTLPSAISCLPMPRADRHTGCMSNTVTIPKAARATPVSKRPRLRLVYSAELGLDSGRVFSLPEGKTWIGRELPTDHPGISLPGDKAMSSIHAVLEVAPGDYRVHISDLRSKNGTWLNHKPVPVQSDSCIIQDGDVLRLGNTFLLLRHEPTRAPDGKVPSLVGVSLAMRELRARLERLAVESTPVIVLGETGSGKDVVATALHKLSRRAGEFVALNCAAIPESLAESELFGHVAGAFNEAKERAGRFRRADRGTLFLDEVGDMPIELQAKLLRALEEKTVTQVGSDRAVAIDVRVIAATNRDLEADIKSGLFREDLWNRLAYFLVVLRPLRQRREDILLLLQHASPEAVKILTPDLVHDLLCFDWPGNVRQLFVVAHRLRAEGITSELLTMLHKPSSPDDDPEQFDGEVPLPDEEAAPADAEDTGPEKERRPYRLPAPTQERLRALMKKYCGTVSHVAEDLNCSRRQVQRWLKQSGMTAEEYRKLEKSS